MFHQRLSNTLISSAMAEEMDAQKLLLGRQLSMQVSQIQNIESLGEVEFSVFSQFGDDGIIQYLINNIPISCKNFIEFGVEHYAESNTRFLLMNDNWSGYVIDGSEKNILKLRKAYYYWRYDIQSVAAFVEKDNINELLEGSGFGEEIGILSIDIDGNDYWVWQAMSVVQPIVTIVEYNSVFGPKRKITVPYEKAFDRRIAHFSGLYYGASLSALDDLARTKGYSFVGCNSAGNNAYFIRSDCLGGFKTLLPTDGYVESKFRESRDAKGDLTYLRGVERLEAIKGLPVVNVETGDQEVI